MKRLLAVLVLGVSMQALVGVSGVMAWDRGCRGEWRTLSDCDHDGTPNWRDRDYRGRDDDGYRDDDGDGIMNNVDVIDDRDRYGSDDRDEE